ncbi:P-loop containing nucleoside triphosphate hydrolase protein [Lentinula aff. detonsa]|uniref:P-loop containing nucleoside triphosphate hydrolase protein n=1 Tax=Lentinula aff. detonsa TaxID=2804958 RepID=A0AA38KCM4_9AGAR|nr:P-loop containing nucleoside triphosphate hydrolase protein [Lentinula aff. detonsa]
MSTTASSSFVPTGLLGPLSNSFSSKDAFAPNGLLSTASTSESNSNDAFKPNGLLDIGQKTSNGSFTPNGLLTSFTDSSTSSKTSSSAKPEILSPQDTASRHATNTTSSASIFAGPPSTTMRATNFDGQTIFLRRKPVTTARRKLAAATQTRQVGNLLNVPLHRLLNEISEDKAKELSPEFAQPDYASVPAAGVDDTLWVDRYRPRTFTDLMGNDRVAREAMEWLKQWDKCVFGKSSKGKKRKRDGEEDNFDVNDPHQRPKQRILLISGPPGLGKTTLAHVIAKQAGYEVMEINASDARSGQIVDDRIRPTLETGYTVKSTKPVLIIIDEIDGATGAGENSSSFIYKLVQLTQDKPRKRNRSTQPGDKRTILRPIICICNDINAASLAKLRPHACQLRLQKPADLHTVRRLREICHIEGLKAEARALSTLVAVAKGDLRGCLNTLQFIRSKNVEVTEAVVRRSTKGMKEADNSVISALNSLFTPLSKKRAKELGLNDEAESRYVSRLSQEIDSCGKDSAIAVGCFSHYATLRRHDANFSRYEKANEWLMTFDAFSAAMYNDGDFALSPYLTYALVPFYPLFQERGAPRVERGQEDWDNLQLTKTNEEIYKSLTRCLQVASTRQGGDFRHLGNWPILQLEFAPFINRIISPQLRPINGQHMRADERPLMTRVVDIMSNLELRFVQERAEDGQLTYRLDPPVDVFVTYDGKRASDIAVSRYAVRHLVAQEVDARVTSRQVDITERGQSGKHAGLFGGAKNSKVNATARSDDIEDDSLKPSPGKRSRQDPSAHVDIADRPPTDFFGRPVQPSANKKTQRNAYGFNPPKSTSVLKFNVAYKFKEGNSAAVRKPIKVSAFL